MNVTFETAKLAKEKGFDFYDTGGYYHINEGYTSGYAFCYSDVNEQTEGCLLCPDQSLLQKWLREVHNIHITVTSISQESWQSHITRKGERLGKSYTEDADTYEEALEVGLLEGLNLIPNEHTQSSN